MTRPITDEERAHLMAHMVDGSSLLERLIATYEARVVELERERDELRAEVERLRGDGLIHAEHAAYRAGVVAERESCAKLAEKMAATSPGEERYSNRKEREGYERACRDIADAIRARGRE